MHDGDFLNSLRKRKLVKQSQLILARNGPREREVVYLRCVHMFQNLTPDLRDFIRRQR